jgi:hypothetical protein
MACGTDPGVWSLGSGEGGGAAKDVPGRKARGGKPRHNLGTAVWSNEGRENAPCTPARIARRRAPRGSGLSLDPAIR